MVLTFDKLGLVGELSIRLCHRIELFNDTWIAVHFTEEVVDIGKVVSALETKEGFSGWWDWIWGIGALGGGGGGGGCGGCGG